MISKPDSRQSDVCHFSSQRISQQCRSHHKIQSHHIKTRTSLLGYPYHIAYKFIHYPNCHLQFPEHGILDPCLHPVIYDLEQSPVCCKIQFQFMNICKLLPSYFPSVQNLLHHITGFPEHFFCCLFLSCWPVTGRDHHIVWSGSKRRFLLFQNIFQLLSKLQCFLRLTVSFCPQIIMQKCSSDLSTLFCTSVIFTQFFQTCQRSSVKFFCLLFVIFFTETYHCLSVKYRLIYLSLLSICRKQIRIFTNHLCYSICNILSCLHFPQIHSFLYSTASTN